MIDPGNITNYNLTDRELEEHVLFWICAAGKNGRTAARCLDNMLTDHAVFYQNNSPFNWIMRAHSLYDLPQILKHYGIGCYNGKAKTFFELAVAKYKDKLNLRTCSAEDLEKIHGIGMKTSRCFIMHSRYGARYAGLDTHLLKYLKAQGIEDVPKATPSSKKQYLSLEKEFLKIADEQGKLPSVLDLEIWNKYSMKSTARA